MLTEEKKVRIDEKINELCEKNNVPGMALVISQHGNPIYENFYGFRDVKEKLPVDSKTIFGLASITKSLTALAIMQLQDAGKLSVEDLVTTWLPEFKLPNGQDEKKLKIHHFLSHTSGLPGLSAVNLARSASIQNDPDGDVLRPAIFNNEAKPPIKTPLELMKEMENIDYSLLGSPGTEFNYSNEAYALLQEIIERASGESFLTYAQENILLPLQMNRSLFLTEDLEKYDNVTELYAKDETGNVIHSPAWWDVGNIYTNGSLKSSIEDVVNYVAIYGQTGESNGVTILSKESKEEMTTPQATMPTNDTYGYGIQVDEINGITLIGHGGGIKGVSSHFKVIPKEGITAVILINLANVPAEKILYAALEEMLPLKFDVPENYPEYKLSEEDLSKYVSLYASKESHGLSVEIHNQMLCMNMDGNKIMLTPFEENGFFTPDGNKIKFLVNETEEITGVFRGKRFLSRVVED